MTLNSTPDEIERRLAEMRSVLTQDVSDLAREAREWVDWRNHFRAHKWLYCGAAAAIGFMLVPRRQRPLRIVASVVGEGRDAQKIEVQPLKRREDGSILKSVLTFAATALVRESLGYLMQRARQDR